MTFTLRLSFARDKITFTLRCACTLWFSYHILRSPDLFQWTSNKRHFHDNKQRQKRPRCFPCFYVFPRKRLSAHTWISRGHVTRVKQVSRIASGEGTRAGCCEMISLLRESRERSVERNGQRPDSTASSRSLGNEIVYANVGAFESQSSRQSVKRSLIVLSQSRLSRTRLNFRKKKAKRRVMYYINWREATFIWIHFFLVARLIATSKRITCIDLAPTPTSLLHRMQPRAIYTQCAHREKLLRGFPAENYRR